MMKIAEIDMNVKNDKVQSNLIEVAYDKKNKDKEIGKLK